MNNQEIFEALRGMRQDIERDSEQPMDDVDNELLLFVGRAMYLSANQIEQLSGHRPGTGWVGGEPPKNIFALLEFTKNELKQRGIWNNSAKDQMAALMHDIALAVGLTREQAERLADDPTPEEIEARRQMEIERQRAEREKWYAEQAATEQPAAKLSATPSPSRNWRDDPATERQLNRLAQSNAAHDPATITKGAASDLIGQIKEYRLVDPTLYIVTPIVATCHLCGRESSPDEMVEGSGHDWDNPDEDLQGSISFLRYHCADGSGCKSARQQNYELYKLQAEIDEAGRYDDNSPGQIGG